MIVFFFFVFVFKKSLKICSGSSLLFRGLTFNLLFSSVFSFVKRKASPLSNSESANVTKHVINFWFQK